MDHDSEPFVDIRTAAAFLHCSRGLIYRDIKKIPHYKLSNKLLFRESELSGYVKRVVPVEQLAGGGAAK